MPGIRLRIDGAGPYGFRLFGGNGEPLVVVKLRPGSKAFNSGVKEGDIILSINENSCSDVTHAAAMSLVNNSGHCLDLNISRDEYGGNSFLSSSLGVRSQDSRKLSPNNPSPQERVRSPGRAQDDVGYQGRVQASSSYVNGTSASPFSREFTTEDESGVDGSHTTSQTTRTTEKIGGTTVTKVTRESHTNWSELGTETEFRNPVAANANKPGVWTPAKHEGRPLTFDLGSPLTIEAKENVAPKTLLPQPPTFSQNKPGVWSPARQEGVQLTWDLGLPLLNEGKINAKSNEPSFFQNHATINVEETKKSSTGGMWRPPSIQATFTPPTNQVTGRPPSVQAIFTPPSMQAIGRSPSVQPTPSAPYRPPSVQPTGKQPSFSAANRQPLFSKFDSDVGYVDEFKLNDLTRNTSNNYTSPPWSRDQPAFPGFPARDQPAFPGLPAHVSKILTAPSGNNFESSSSVSFNKKKEKVFGDSAFYADSKHNYPTMDEQVKMARNVAMSLTSGDNTSARGHQMFLKRKEKSDAYVSENGVAENEYGGAHKGAENDSDLYYNPTPWNPAKTWKPSPGANLNRGGYAPPSIPAPPPLPASLLFVPNLKNVDERSKSLSAEEFERVRLYDQKTTHNIIAPQVCFNIAKDLRENKGKGGRMFAKRREKADQWVVEDKGPDPAVLMKLAGGFTSAPVTSARRHPEVAAGVDERDYSAAPSINRLKEMIEIPKAKMTPWDAVAEYGNVELAFDHLKDFSFAKSTSSNSYQPQVGQRGLDNFEITPAPSGPPSWARSSETTEAFSTSSASKFSPKVDFSQRSNAGFKAVQFSAPRQQAIAGQNSGDCFSEF